MSQPDEEVVIARDPRVPWLILAVTILTLALAAAVIFIIHLYTSGHANRLADQAARDQSLREIACLNISQVNENDPKLKLTKSQKELARQYRAKYNCPPYSKRRAKHPFEPLPPVPPGSPVINPAVPSPKSVPPAQAGPGHIPSVRRTHSVPSPGTHVPDSGTPRPSPSASPRSTPTRSEAPSSSPAPLVQICATPLLPRCVRVG